MKLFSLNSHSLHGEDFSGRVAIFCAALAKELPDVVALQEVNQPRDGQPPEGVLPLGHTPCRTDIPMHRENFALRIAQEMEKRGIDYFWTWLPMKIGYGKYDEGLAVFCRRPLAEVRAFTVSAMEEYENYHTRMALWVRPEGSEFSFCNLHTSRWHAPKSPFAGEWERLMSNLDSEEPVFLMGDFNNPAEIRGEGYDLMSRCGFYDAYELAEKRSGRGTARIGIDGWKERDDGTSDGLIRIDHILCNRPVRVTEYRTVFNGVDFPEVSDHFGVLVTVEEKERIKHEERIGDFTVGQ